MIDSFLRSSGLRPSPRRLAPEFHQYIDTSKTSPRGVVEISPEYQHLKHETGDRIESSLGLRVFLKFGMT